MKLSLLWSTILIGFLTPQTWALSKPQTVERLRGIYKSCETQIKIRDKAIETLTFESMTNPTPQANSPTVDSAVARLSNLAIEKQDLIIRLDLLSYLVFKFDSGFSGNDASQYLRESLRDYLLGLLSAEALLKDDNPKMRDLLVRTAAQLRESQGDDQDVLNLFESLLLKVDVDTKDAKDQL